MNLLPVCIDMDGSIPFQGQLVPHLAEIAPLHSEQKNLRLWANKRGLKLAQEAIQALRKKRSEPWLTFLGSGDFHHITTLLLKTLSQEMRPLTLVLIDNHPDWFVTWPPYHCGNWVSQVVKLPWVKKIYLVGQDSSDISGWHFWSAPFNELCQGCIHLYPYARKKARVPFKWPSATLGVRQSARRFYGVDLYFDTILEKGPEEFFRDLAAELKDENIYISLDKDCLRQEVALTDWEQGRLELPTLLYGIERLMETGRVIGADICGEQAPELLKGIFKRIDSGRVFKKPSIFTEANKKHQETNLSLLRAFSVRSLEIKT